MLLMIDNYDSFTCILMQNFLILGVSMPVISVKFTYL